MRQIYLTWMFALICSLGFAQQRKVTGIVVEEQTNEPLIGVTVGVEGSTTGTITDVDGNFSINAPIGKTLSISYVGMITQKIKVTSGTTPLTIVMKKSDITLEEVVVVGYGVQKKANLTGAIAATSGEALQKYSSPNPSSTLQGILPGLQVTQASGRPGGEGISLQVRGLGSYGSNTDPLIIVDGIPGSMPTSENIENVTVLKDAASAAIYGSRAANGVILITTKRGKSGHTNLEYGVSYGLYSASKLPDVITNSADFMTLWNQAAIHSDSPGDQYSESDIAKYRNANGNSLYPNTNWMDLIFRDVWVANHALTITGGNDKTTYNLNFNYLSQPGIEKGTDYSRYTSRLNVETKLNKYIKAGVNASFGYGETKSPIENNASLFQLAFRQSPTYGPYLTDGSNRIVRNAFNSIEFKNAVNPFSSLDGSESKTTSINAQLNPYLKITFTDWLTWDINGSVSANWSKTKSFAERVKMYDWSTGNLSQTVDAGGFAGLNVNDGNSINPIFFTTLNFNKTFGDHQVSALGGMQIEYSKVENLSAFRKSYLSNLTQEIDAGGLDGIQNGGTTTEYSMVSYFGRANYSYKSKYLAEFNIRADGSSRFAKGHRWGFFPSGSIGWRPFQESFIPKIKFIDDAKIRASYGVLGNQGINNYPYQSVMGVGNRNFYSFDNTNIVNGISSTGLVNGLISWEKTNVFDVGIDLNLFNNQFLFTFDWFKKKTTGILRKQQVTYETGYPSASPYINNGEMQNTGFEFSAEYRGHVNKFQYSVNWNVQTYKNEVTSFGADEINPSPYSPTIIREGSPYNSFYIYEWDGIFQTQAEADASGQANKPKAGDLRIKDQDGNHIIDGNDKKIFDGVFPKFTSGLRLSASYANFDFSAFFYGSFGQKVYVYGDGLEPFYQGSVPTKDWLDAWTPENHSTTMPAVYNSQRYNSTWSQYPNSWFLQSNSYVRLKNVNVGYTFNLGKATNQIVKDVRVYFSGDNLLTFTGYKGLDPERTGGSGAFLTYPQTRSFTFGANIKF